MSINKTYIISLGGSLIIPKDGIDWQFLKKFRNFILNQVKLGRRFYIVVGGGTTARNYIAAADRIIKTSRDGRDWLGIYATRLNAYLVRTLFEGAACAEIIIDPTIRLLTKEKIIIASGWKPGNSTDYVATVIAEQYNIKTIINLSNIDYVYDKDPKKFKNAKKIIKTNWRNFRKLVGNKWDPGLSKPFDPIASKKAQQLGLEVVIMNGKNISNLKKYFSGDKFKGTVIR